LTLFEKVTHQRRCDRVKRSSIKLWQWITWAYHYCTIFAFYFLEWSRV